MDYEAPGFLEKLAKLDPAIVRALIITVVGIVGAIVGHQVGNEVVDTIVNFALALLALVAGLVIRPAVTPNAKVLAYKPNPVDAPNLIAPGEATIENTIDQKDRVVVASIKAA